MGEVRLTLAFVVIQRICEEWRRADAFSGLYTLLVRATVSVRNTADLVGRAHAVMRVTTGAFRTFARVRSGNVPTLSSVAASMTVLRAFVDIFKTKRKIR